MRKASTFSLQAAIPRMSWSPKNLYNLLARSTVPIHIQSTNFTKTSSSIYQQRWRSKRLLRGYHGDWIQENRFKRWFLPTNLPQFKNQMESSQKSTGSLAGSVRSKTLLSSTRAAAADGNDKIKLPISSLFVRDVERRLDTAIFRACFVRSAYEARRIIVHGKVSINGVKQTNPNTLLSPKDLVSVEPSAIPMLSQELATRSDKRKAQLEKAKEISKARNAAHSGSLKGEKEEQAEEIEGKEKEGEEERVKTDGEKSAASSTEEETSTPSAETDSAKQEEKKAETSNQDAKSESTSSSTTATYSLPPGVLPFNLPPFATPFLFIPPFLEVSFTTCSFIYLRHPTILSLPTPSSSSSSSSSILTNQESKTPDSDYSPTKSLPYRTDLPSPYDPNSEIFSLASEHYSRNSPRVRGDLRRERDEARIGRNGFVTARAKDSWRRKRAVRKGWARGNPLDRKETVTSTTTI